MDKQNSFGKYLESIVADIKNDVNMLYSNSNKHKWDTLKSLENRVSTLEELIQVINNSYILSVQAVPQLVTDITNEQMPQAQQPSQMPQSPPAPQIPVSPQTPAPPVPPQMPPIPQAPKIGIQNVPVQPKESEKVFTQEELAKYDGKNGNPAYVAVNGIVYDVSNIAAWGAATHFGLTSGADRTAEYSSCHGGEDILNKLPKVGVLAVSGNIS